jgi:hypothetical protein
MPDSGCDAIDSWSSHPATEPRRKTASKHPLLAPWMHSNRQIGHTPFPLSVRSQKPLVSFVVFSEQGCRNVKEGWKPDADKLVLADQWKGLQEPHLNLLSPYLSASFILSSGGRDVM